jgi:hypothetical protein
MCAMMIAGMLEKSVFVLVLRLYNGTTRYIYIYIDIFDIFDIFDIYILKFFDIDIDNCAPGLKNILQPQFMDFHDKLECLVLASLTSQV